MLTSGMSLGKEGPFIHISSCIAMILPYKELRFNKTLTQQFLSAAIAVGVAITFGAPIGGMLFAIEVTSTQFTVNCLWKSFFASTVAILCFKALRSADVTALFSADASYFYSGKAQVGINHEQPFFIILGVLCGCIGTFYIYFQRVVNTYKAKMTKEGSLKWFFSNPWFYNLTMTFICINIIYFTKLMQTGDRGVINSLMNFDIEMAKLNLTSANAK
jgi:H+/Cl- antiporter ClcA